MKQKETNTVIRPYKGLHYFEESDADRFFGREELTAELVEHLRSHRPPPGTLPPTVWKGNFLAIIGASGSGKSSLVRAGLLPALLQGGIFEQREEIASYVNAEAQEYQKGRANGHQEVSKLNVEPDGAALASQVGLPINGQKNFLVGDRANGAFVHVMTPTAHPLEALAATLTRDEESEEQRKALANELAGDPRTLDLYAHKLLSQKKAHSETRIWLIIDQFEELFTLCTNPIERRAFVDNLMDAVRREATVVVMALRADFYAHCAEFDELRHLLERQQKFIGLMNEDQLRRAIEEPARVGGWLLQEGLVELLLEESRAQSDLLPRLSHALLETWKRRDGRMLTLAGYAEAGRVENAIAQSAEALFKQLTIKEQAITRSIFMRLLKIGAPSASADKTRRATLIEVMQSGRRHEVSIVERVIHGWVYAGLITIHDAARSPSIQQKAASAPSAEITFDGKLPDMDQEVYHDASNGHQSSRHESQTPQNSPFWRIRGRADRKGGLFPVRTSDNEAVNGHEIKPNFAADRLEDPKFWSHNSQLADQDEYLATVEIAHDALIAHWPRLRQWLDEKRDQWRIESRLTESARLWERHNRAPRYLYRGARLTEAEMVSDMLHLDGLKREFLEASLAMREQNAPEGDHSHDQTPPAPAQSRWWKWGAILALALMSVLFAISSAQAAMQWYQMRQLHESSHARELTAEAQAVRDQKPQRSLLLALEAVAVSEDADGEPSPAALQVLRDALASTGGLDMGEQASGIHVVGTAPNPHNQMQPYWLVTGNGHGELGLWQPTYNLSTLFMVSPKEPAMRLKGHADRITAMTTYNNWLVTGSRDGSIRLWNFASADLMATSIYLQGHEKQVHKLDTIGHWLISDSDDNTVRLWDLRHPSPTPITLVSHQNYIGSTFAPDANGQRPYLITAIAYDVYLWDLSSDDPSQQAAVKIGNHADRMGAVAMSNDKRWLVSGSNDSSVRLWDLSDPSLLAGTLEPRYLQAHNNQIRVVGVSPDKRWVFTTGGQDAFLWDFTSPEMTSKPIHLPGHKDEIKKAMISPDSHWLVTTSSRQALLWDLHKMPVEGRTPIELRGYEDRISALAISPDSRWLVIGSYDHNAYLWDLQAPLATNALRLQGHDEPIEAITTSADNWLITHSRNGRARLWDLREPITRQLTYLANLEEELNTSRIPTTDAHWLISNEYGPPPISTLTVEELSALACEAAGRNFTQAEWETYFAAQRIGYRKTCPDLPVHPSAIAILLEEGQVLAKRGQLDEATGRFEKALALDADLATLLNKGPLDPETDARKVAAQALIEEGERLAHKGEVEKALAAYDKAQELYPEIEISGPSWNTLCRFGSPWGYAKQVMFACEKAVLLNPEHGLAHNSRALARALSGDYAGAIEDYQFFIQWSQEVDKYLHYIPLRKGWVAKMQAGRNPFDEETLMKLRYE